MKEAKQRRILPAVILPVLLILLFLGILFHRSISLLIDNLTVGKLPMDTLEEWDRGTSLKGIAYADASPAQYLDLYIPADTEHPRLLVLIHGGGFLFGDSDTRQVRWMYRYFRDHGYAVASVNYRLAEEAPYPAALEDCRSALRFLRENADTYGYSADRIALFGESAGGYLATMCAVAGEEQIAVLIDYYPYIEPTMLRQDLRDMGFPYPFYLLANNWLIGSTDGFEDFDSCWHRRNFSEMTEEERAEANPLSYISASSENLQELSVYLIHGDADITVPYASSVRLFEALSDVLPASRLTFRTEPGMGHASDPLYREEILEEIDAFMKAH